MVGLNKTKTVSPPASGVYLFTGEDEFRKEAALQAFKRKFLSVNIDAFNCETFSGKENIAEEIIRSLETLPLAASRKLIILKEPETLSKEDKGILAAYLRKRASSRVMLVMVSDALASRDDKFISSLSEIAEVMDFSSLAADEIAAWIVKEFKARNKAISYGLAKVIGNASGTDLARASSIIEQVSIFTGDREKITEDDILHFTEENVSEASAFKFLDSINERDTSGSLQVLKNLITSGNAPPKIVGLLSWHITRLIAVKRFIIKGVSKSSMLSHFNIGTYTLNKLISQAENFTLKQLKAQLDALLDTDLMLKKSTLRGDLLLELLIVKWGRI